MDRVTTLRRIDRGVRRRVYALLAKTPTLRDPISQPCTFEQILSPEYASWCDRLQQPHLHHRKLWEWVYILRVLEHEGMLGPHRRGLGFGVGNEPIAAYAAREGASVVGTDLHADDAASDSWQETGQHASQLADLNELGLCPPDVFAARVSFRPVDMSAIPDDLVDFDFSWSACAFEHLGSLDAGLDFIERQLATLKPGGVGVHTTEYAIDPYGPTVAEGPTVLYRRADLERLVGALRKQGHHIEATYKLGTHPEDVHVDLPPFTNTHIRTATEGHAHTSFGLWVRKRG